MCIIIYLPVVHQRQQNKQCKIHKNSFDFIRFDVSSTTWQFFHWYSSGIFPDCVWNSWINKSRVKKFHISLLFKTQCKPNHMAPTKQRTWRASTPARHRSCWTPLQEGAFFALVARSTVPDTPTAQMNIFSKWFISNCVAKLFGSDFIPSDFRREESWSSFCNGVIRLKSSHRFFKFLLLDAFFIN